MKLTEELSFMENTHIKFPLHVGLKTMGATARLIYNRGSSNALVDKRDRLNTIISKVAFRLFAIPLLCAGLIAITGSLFIASATSFGLRVCQLINNPFANVLKTVILIVAQIALGIFAIAAIPMFMFRFSYEVVMIPQNFYRDLAGYRNHEFS